MAPRRAALLLLVLLASPSLRADEPTPPASEDLLTFAAGAVPIEVAGAGAALGTGFEHALYAIDGDEGGFTLHRRLAEPTSDFVFVYELPSATTFSSFAIPNVFETPSPNQTFVATIEIEGSSVSATEGFQLLASTTFQVHTSPEQTTTLAPLVVAPVRWLRVRLAGGIEEGATFFEFSELVGRGTREPVDRVDHFTGMWDAPSGTLELYQDGAVVVGCADDGRKALEGTVMGNLLRGTLVDVTSGTPGAFILSLDGDGDMRGVRSDNGGPFRVIEGPPEPEGVEARCAPAGQVVLGCGAVVHGITFAYDSAVILPESTPVLQALHAGLALESSVTVVGHTSSEGSDEYNQQLSERRAAAVVDALVALGVPAEALSSAGRGEHDPIANNGDETGRSLNRRVEIECIAPTP